MSQSIHRYTDTQSTLVPVNARDELLVRKVEAHHLALLHSANRSSFHVINGVAYPRDGFDIDRVIAFLVSARARGFFDEEGGALN